MEMSEGLGTNVVSKGRELMGIKLKCYILQGFYGLSFRRDRGNMGWLLCHL